MVASLEASNANEAMVAPMVGSAFGRIQAVSFVLVHLAGI
jgi:hypothetical protein